MKAMISQPMNGLTDEEIFETRNKAIMWLSKNRFDLVDTLCRYRWFLENLLLTNHVKNEPLYYLSLSLGQMSQCDAVYFCKGWENYRGCRIEHEAAEVYGLKIIEEV